MKRLRPDIEYAQIYDKYLERPITQLEPRTWIARTRAMLGVTSVQLAQRMKIGQSAISALEQAETNGKITINKLDQIADTLNCRLVYAFVPKARFEEMAREQQVKFEEETKRRRYERDFSRRRRR